MKEDCHVDLSNRFYSKKTTGIAFVGAKTKRNKGCALHPRIKRSIERELFIGPRIVNDAKLYAICIYFLIKEDFRDIEELIVCNDEIFLYVKDYLIKLFEADGIEFNSKIISITEFRESLGRRVKSLADNYAKIYAKRGLKPTRWNRGKKINVVKITYEMIKDKWVFLDKK